ncbi:MAG: pilin assembly protein [Cellvibrionaceae bacterium]|nr:pilin assembly protein [Cellvibrionaceae bacterium]|tara:strand:+ start:38088 stop:38429 length:342 start_codon:yes stop_codon:yes gene_type:complete
MNMYQQLQRKWHKEGEGELTRSPYCIYLTEEHKNKLEDLCQRYPRIGKETLIRDLLSAALKDVETALPYQPGSKVIAWDECGDEIYEDCGLTPKLLARTKHYQTQLRLQPRES